MQSRRDFGRLVLAGLPLSVLAGDGLVVDGVRLGVCTYSFRDLPHAPGGDATGPVIKAFGEVGAGLCELFSPQLEPAISSGGGRNSPEATKRREDLRQWRLSTPSEHFESVRKEFDHAGITIYAYTLNFRSDFTDEELEKCFQQTKALGVKIIAASTQLSVAPRLVPLAEKYDILVAMHGHSNTANADEFSSPESFGKALKMSKQFRVNLDIGHFAAAGFDPVAFIRENHDVITHLHIKDRKKNDGPNEPFGEGDTPIKQVLALLKDERYKIPALVEYEYKGTGSSIDEVRKCLAYEKSALTSA